MLYEKIITALAKVQSEYMELGAKRELLLELRTKVQQCEGRLNHLKNVLSPELQKTISVKDEIQELLEERTILEGAFNELGYGTVESKQLIKSKSRAKRADYLETDVAENKE